MGVKIEGLSTVSSSVGGIKTSTTKSKPLKEKTLEYIERWGNVGLDIADKTGKAFDFMSEKPTFRPETYSEEVQSLVKKGQLSALSKTEFERLNQLIKKEDAGIKGTAKVLEGTGKGKAGVIGEGMVGGFAGAGLVGRTLFAPATPLIEDVIVGAVNKTGGEGGTVSKGLELISDYSKGIEDDIIKNIMGGDERVSEVATEGLMAGVGTYVGMTTAPLINIAVKSSLGAVGELAVKTTKQATGLVTTATKKVAKYTPFMKEADDGINSTIIKTDLASKVDAPIVKEDVPLNISEGVKTSIENIGKSLDGYVNTLNRLQEAKDLGDTSIETTKRILNEEGFKSVAEYVSVNENKIETSNVLSKKIKEVGIIDDADDKIKIVNELHNSDKIDFVGEVFGAEGTRKYQFTNKLEDGKPIEVDADIYDDRIGNPAEVKNLSPIDKAIRLLKGNELEVKGINDAFNRIGKDKTAEFDFISYSNRINEKYNLNLKNEIDKLADDFTIEGAKELADKITENKGKFFFRDKNYLATEFRNLKHKLKIEEKVINTAFTSGVKEGVKITKEALNKKILEINSKNKIRIEAIRKRQKETINKINEANKIKNEKLREKAKARLIKEQARLEEKIKKIKEENRIKIEELRVKRDGVIGATRYISDIIKKTLNDKRFKGIKVEGLLRQLTRIATKKDLKKEQFISAVNDIVYKIHKQYQSNLVSEIKKEASVIKNFKKSRDVSERKKYSAIFTLIGDYKKTYNKLLLSVNKGMPIETLEEILSEIRKINDASIKFAKNQKDVEGLRVVKITKDILNEKLEIAKAAGKKDGGVFTLFGDVMTGDKTFKNTIANRIRKIQAINNFPLYWAHAAKKMSRGSKTFLRTFVNLPINAYNKFLGDFDDVNLKGAEALRLIESLGKKDLEENLNKLGFYANFNRKIKGVEGGEDIWIGAENQTAAMYEVNGTLKNKYKSDIKGLKNAQKPTELIDLPDYIWDKLKGTKGHEWILWVIKNEKALKAYEIGRDFYDDNWSRVAGVAAQEDGVIVDQHINYFPSMSKNSGVDVVQDISGKKSAQNMKDTFIHGINRNKALRGGNELETNFMRIFLSGARNQLYYVNMKPILNLMKDVYFGRKINSSIELKEMKLIDAQGLLMYDKEKFSKHSLVLVNKDGNEIIPYDGQKIDIEAEDLAVRKLDGLNTKFGENADYRMKEFLNRVAIGGIGKSGELDSAIYKLNMLAAGSIMSFNISPIIKQALTYGDAAKNFDIKELSYGASLLAENIEIDGVKKSMYQHILDVSPEIKNRSGALNILKDVKNSENITFFGGVDVLNKVIEKGLLGMTKVDQSIAVHLFMVQYSKFMKSKFPDITDEEIRLLNNMEGIGEANRVVIELMSTGDDLFTSPAMGTLFGKVFLSLTGTMQNRYGKFLIDFDADYYNKGFTSAVMLNSRFMATNIAEAVATYYISYLKFQLGLSTFDIQNSLEDENLFKDFLNSQIKQIPILGNFVQAIQNPDFGNLQAITWISNLYKGVENIVSEEGDGGEGVIRLLKNFGFGDIAGSLRNVFE